jgi:hypothetical protein
MGKLRSEFPKLEIHEERPRWLDWIFHLPLIEKFEWYNSTQAIGDYVFLSDQWEEKSPAAQMEILRHERQHLLQFQKYGLFLMAVLYLFVFFPIGLAYYRAKFERQGYAESLAARVEYEGATELVRESSLGHYLRTFTGPTYLWMWPFREKVEEWFEIDFREAVKRGDSLCS